MNVWIAEILHSWRANLRRPGFVLLAIGVLALGVGASVSVFTLIDNTLMQPLPVPQPSRLVVMGAQYGGEVGAASPMQYQHMSGIEGVSSLGLEQSGPTANVAGGEGGPRLVHVMLADRGLLPTLGIQPVLGRNFSVQEDSPQGPPVVMLTWGFWQQRFGGARDVIGRTLDIDGHAHRIIGVLPKSYAALGFEGDIMLPFALPPNDMDNGNNQAALARLSGSANIQTVNRELDTRMHAMFGESLTNAAAKAYWAHKRFAAEGFKKWLHDGERPVLGLFLVSALFVLVIALVNLTNLMLFRALSRSHDAAVRNALGAPLLRELLPALAEGLLIGLGGAVLGLCMAFIGLQLLQGYIPAGWLNGAPLHFGTWVWVLAFAASLLGTLLATSLGLWRSRVAGTVEELRAGGRSGIGRRGNRIGRALVVFQVVMATGLLCAVGLFLHTLYDAQQTPLGFTAGNTLTFEMSPLQTAYPDAASVDRLSKRLVRQLEAIPGVTHATATTNLPTGSFMDQFNVGMQTVSGHDFEPQYHGVGLGFFHLFGIHLREGRLFTADDVRGGEKVAIVDQALADHYYGGHALNQLILEGGGKHPWEARIVGVVDSTYQFGAQRGPASVVYVPLAQMTDSYLRIFMSFEPMRFALRVQGNPYSYRESVRRTVAQIAPNQPIANFRSMRDVIAITTASLRLDLLLVGIFAGLALALAAIGLYAVMAVAVAAREHEFGVRTALGATPGSLLRLVLREGLTQTIIGLVLGVILSLTLSVAMSSVVEAMGSTRVIDPPSILAACIVLGITGLLACTLPALRAAHAQPMRALRGE